MTKNPLRNLLLSLFIGEIVSFFANDMSLPLLFTEPANALDEALVGLVLGLLLFITFEIYNLRVDMIRNNEITQKNASTLKSINARTDHLDKYGQIVSRLYSNDIVVKESGMSALINFIDDFDVGDGSVSFIGEKLSLDAFEVLWRNMIRESRKHNYPVRAYAVHVVSARIWNEDYSARLIDLQKEFLKTNAEVYRIFVESPYTDIDISNYDKAMKRMEESGIKTCIIRLNYLPALLTGGLGEAYHDFLIFDSLDTYSKWNIDPYARRIMGTETRRIRNPDDSKYLKVKGLWNSLVEKVLEFDFDNIPDGHSEKTFTPEMVKISKGFQAHIRENDIKLPIAPLVISD